MKSLVFVVSLVNVALAISPQVVPFKVRPLTPNSTGVDHRIYKGTPAAEGQFPFMIFTMIKASRSEISKCSSSLITPEWVLLAAHCLSFPSLLPQDILLVGQRADLWEYVVERVFHLSFYEPIDEFKWGVQERRAMRFFVHPQYSEKTLEHDVALIQVTRPFVLGPKVGTIALSEDRMRTLKLCTILGWGLTEGNIDQQKLNFLSNRTASTTKIGCDYKATGAFICLESQLPGICMGDSGSPLVCDGKVWGVASHLVSNVVDPDCGASLEEYYSELYYDLDWIKKILKRNGSPSSGSSLRTGPLCLLAALWLLAKK